MKKALITSRAFTCCALAAVLLTLGTSCNRGSSPSAPSSLSVSAGDIVPKVTVGKAVIKDVPQDESYSSSIEAYATNNIAPQSAGRIQKINVEVGDFVSKGDILAEMDKVQLNQTRLALVNDSTEFSRIKGLYAEGAVSQSDYESMELAYNVRKSTYENLLENTILRAPISGVITARNYDRGDLFAMTQPLFVLQQISPVKLYVGISESDYTRVKRGDSVNITVDALPGRSFTGKITRINPTINAMTHTVSVEVQVPNSSRELRPGMYAKVVVNFASRRSVTVPDAAVVKQQGSGQRIVYVLNDDNTVEMRVVELGRHVNGEYELLGGVSDGETVVVKGQASLRGGVKVEVVNNI